MKGEKSSVAQACSACTSLVCMAQMGAMGAAGGVAMGTMGAATVGSLPVVTILFQFAGLGFLLLLPPIFYQILLVIVLSFTNLTAGLSYKIHKNGAPLTFTIVSSFLLYASIYFFASELLYWVAFVLMLVSAVWSYRIAKRRKITRHEVINVKLASGNPNPSYKA